MVSWRFDSIPNIGTENRLGLCRFVSKILETDSGFGSIPRIGIVGSDRFQKLEPKFDPTVSLVKIDINTKIDILNTTKSS